MGKAKREMTSGVWQAGLEAIAATTPILGPAAVAMIRAAKDSEEIAERHDLESLSEEAHRQTLELRMAQMQAEVAQEIAIAQRIASAEEVEIEEYYEGEAEGSIGVKTDSEALTIGLGAKGRKVTRRIFRFKGGSGSSK